MGNVSHGPSIVTDGLVLCLDNYNEQSYLGQPTTNNRADISDWTVGADGSPSGGQGTVTFSSDGYLANVVNVNQNVKFSNSLTVTANGTYTHSMKFRLISGSVSWNTISFYMYTTGHGSHWVWASGADSMDLTNTTEWQTVEHTWTMTGGSTLMNFHIGAQGGVAYNNSFEIKDIQIEEKPHATKFVDGTRSATDGWKDLSGNLQASGQTFDSDLDQLSYSSTNVPGTNVNSFSFDGTNDYALIRSASDDVPLGNEPRTLEAWFSKSNDSSSNDVKIIFGYGQGATNGGHCYLCHNYNKAFFWGYSSSDLIGTTTLTDDVMYHMVATSDGSTKHLYLNAVSEVSDTVAMNTSNVNDWVTIGRYTSGSYRANQGNIDVVRIYNRALSAAEVLRNYNANKGRYGL